MNARLTFIHALSPLHAGTGQGVGVIDLPIAREKATNLPYLPGSTLKGSLRDELKNDELRNKIFGPEKVENDSAYSGSVVFTDQKLLCLPVRSLLGTFAWVTSPYILERFKRDCEGNNLSVPKPDLSNCYVSDEPQIIYNDTQIILEDLDLTAQSHADAESWAELLAKFVFKNDTWRTYFKQRFCIVSDDVMNFLAETATEVIARNVLNDETKTSDNLWYEESLPAETILSGLLVAVKNNPADINELQKHIGKTIQLGGSMTVGRGLCRMTIAGMEEAA